MKIDDYPSGRNPLEPPHPGKLTTWILGPRSPKKAEWCNWPLPGPFRRLHRGLSCLLAQIPLALASLTMGVLPTAAFAAEPPAPTAVHGSAVAGASQQESSVTYDGMVPAVARNSGANATFWRSYLAFFSPTDMTLRLAVGSQQQTATEGEEVELLLNAGETKVFPDALGALFPAFRPPGALFYRVVEGDPANLVVSSRLFTDRQGGGTLGQGIDGILLNRLAPRWTGMSLPSLPDPVNFRLNVGLVNVTGADMRFEIGVGNADGSSISSLSTIVKPYSLLQVNNLFSNLNPPIDPIANAWVFVIPANRGGLAYASIVDNRSGDPAFFPDQWTHARRSTKSVIPVMAHLPGVGSSDWVSETRRLFLPADYAKTPWDVPAQFPFVYLAEGRANCPLPPGALPSRQLKPLQLYFSLDSLQDLFGIERGKGAVFSGDGAPPSAWFGRISTVGPDGSYGQSMPQLILAENEIEPGDVGYLIALSENGAFRTNIGLVETKSLESGECLESRVRLTVFDTAGRELGQQELTLQPGEMHQLNGFLAPYAPVTDARVDVTVLSGGVVAYGSVVDGVTNDPLTIRAQRLRPFSLADAVNWYIMEYFPRERKNFSLSHDETREMLIRDKEGFAQLLMQGTIAGRGFTGIDQANSYIDKAIDTMASGDSFSWFFELKGATIYYANGSEHFIKFSDEVFLQLKDFIDKDVLPDMVARHANDWYSTGRRPLDRDPTWDAFN